MRMLLNTIAVLVLAGILPTSSSAASAARVDGYKIVAKMPHSRSSYTEGFFFLDGKFYEGVGMKGQSGIVVSDPKTGKILARHDLTGNLFGEGVINWGPNIYQWTWQSNLGYVFDRAELKQLATFSYSGEGWGMTRTDKEIITSDGSARLTFRDPSNFHALRQIAVTDGGIAVDQLNELEFIKGEIWANVWHSDRIARISPADGHVISWVDCTGILPASDRPDPDDVLNGIAYDDKTDRIFITGKRWPTVFEIKVVPKK